jgi:AraC family transcriptional regulator, transcriptional activator FtrA
MTHTIPDMGTFALAVTDGMLHFELSGGTAP